MLDIFPKWLAAVILACGLLSVLVPLAPPASGASVDWTGDTLIATSKTVNGDIVTLTGNLTITGSLTLNGAELRMDAPYQGAYGIHVENGGTFNVLAGSTIHSTNANVHFTFQVQPGATLNMNASTLRDCGWDDWDNWTTNPNTDRGLYIDSDLVSITNSTITGNCVGILVDNGTSPFIHRNNISANDDCGVAVFGGATPVIDRNTISGNLRSTFNWGIGGIASDGSSPVITNNTISANLDLYYQSSTYGIYLSTGGSPLLMYNNITGHKQAGNTWSYGVYGWGCSPSLYQNNIFNNYNGLYISAGGGAIEGNLFDNNKLPSGPSMGYGVYDSGWSTYANNTFSRNNIGLFMEEACTSTFYNDTFSSNGRAGVDGQAWRQQYTVLMTNCTFTNNGQDVFLETQGGMGVGGTLTLVNPSYSPALVRITDPQATLTVEWFFRAKVIWENGSIPVDGAVVNTTNARGKAGIDLLTGPEGWTDTQLLEEYSRTGGTTSSKSPYRINARKGDKTNSTPDVALTGNRNATVILDDIAPMVRITEPAGGTLTNRTTIRVAGVTEPRANVTVNGIHASVGQNGSWSAQVPLDNEGANDISAQALDAALNSAGDAVTVFRDTVTPALTLTAPKDGFLTNKTTVLVEGRTTDVSATTTVNGVTVTVLADGSFKHIFNLTEGDNTITVESRDTAQNYDRILVSGVSDTIPPELAVLEPRNGFATNRTALKIRGNVEEGAALTMNGRFIKPDEMSFSVDVTLDEGNNTFSFQARDKAGNVNISVLVVLKDSLPPPLVILSPSDGAIVNHTLIDIKGTTEPGALLRINDVTIEHQGAGFCATVELANEGANTITLEVSDALRNGFSRTMTVYLDTVPPPLALKGPVNGLLTNQSSVEVRGRTDAGTIVKVNGQRTPVDRDGCFTATVELMQEGANPIVVVATDAAGNSEQARVTILRDSFVNYTITSPADGDQVKTKNITVTGKAEPGSTVTVSGIGVSPRADGSFSLDMLLVDGPNVIVIAIRDRAGNTVTETMTVTKLKAARPAASKGFIPGFEGLLLLAALSVPSAWLLHRKR